MIIYYWNEMKKVNRIFKALSDPTRLRIVFLLLDRELCVCELMAILGLEQSRISHQLRILRDGGLLRDDREGRWIIYRMPEAVKERLRPLLEMSLREDPAAAKIIRSDRASMQTCIRNEIRIKRCGA